MNSKRMNDRMSEKDLAIRRTTLPLHSFLDTVELSVYYILDRLPIRNPFGVESKEVLRVIAGISGLSVEQVTCAVSRLRLMSIVSGPTPESVTLGSAIMYDNVYKFCSMLGAYPIGFGRFLRYVTCNSDVTKITPAQFGRAENDMKKASRRPQEAPGDVFIPSTYNL